MSQKESGAVGPKVTITFEGKTRHGTRRKTSYQLPMQSGRYHFLNKKGEVLVTKEITENWITFSEEVANEIFCFVEVSVYEILTSGTNEKQ